MNVLFWFQVSQHQTEHKDFSVFLRKTQKLQLNCVIPPLIIFVQDFESKQLAAFTAGPSGILLDVAQLQGISFSLRVTVLYFSDSQTKTGLVKYSEVQRIMK